MNEPLARTSYDQTDYIADLIYREDCKSKGTSGPRWWCLRDDYKAKYRGMAIAVFNQWARDEQLVKAKYSGDSRQ